MKTHLHILLPLLLLACLATARAQVSTGVFDSTAIAIDMDSTDTGLPVPDTSRAQAPTGVFDPTAIAIDMDSTDTAAYSYPYDYETPPYSTDDSGTIDTALANALFRAIDKLLPDVELSYMADTVYRLYRIDNNYYGEIKQVTGNAKSVDFKIASEQEGIYGITHSHTFDQAYEFMLTDDIDVIVLVSDNGHALYLAYCSPERLCNHLAYLIELDSTSISVYELDSESNADVAMFNYTLDHVNSFSGSTIYPLSDIEQPAKFKKNRSISHWGTVATSVAGSILAGVTVILLLLML